MKEQNFFGLHLDFVGFTASMLCAIHCAALPLLLSAGLLGSIAWLHAPWVEGTFIAASLVVASWSLLRSYFSHHQRFIAISVVVFGFLLIIVSRFVAENWEPLLTAGGGVLIAVAHIINWRLCKKCSIDTPHFGNQPEDLCSAKDT